MTAFLFDEDHPELDMVFGPQCASQIIRVLEDIPGLPAFRMLRGSLLHMRYCYKLSEVTLLTQNASSSGFASTSSSSQSLEADKNHLLTIICDLAETMSASGSNLSESEIQDCLATKNIWVVVIQSLPDEYRLNLEKSLISFGPFIGWVRVDWNDPIHSDLFSGSLFSDMLIDGKGLCKLSDWEDGGEDRAEEEAILKEYGSKFEARLMNYEDFSAIAPPLLAVENPNERSMLSVKRIVGNELSHREKIGKALVHEFVAQGDFRTFSTSKPNDDVEFLVSEAKLTKYLLNADHPKGGSKATFFRDTLDIVQDDWRYLADQFCQAAPHSEFYRLNVTGYGVMHGAHVLIIGRNGRQAVVETGWKLEATGPAQFVTAYPGDESKLDELVSFAGRVPELNCNRPERWKKIHEMAHHCGMLRGESKVPTPMVLEKWGTIWDGACGFGWVRLPDARVPFAKWAVKEGIGYASRPGVHISSKIMTQSIQKNLSYAFGYAEVLKANGIECRAESRLD